MKDCPSFNGYSATEDGRIFSHRRRGVRTEGHGGTRICVDPSYSYELTQQVTPKGYHTVSIMFANGKARPVGVHQLVADAYLGPVPDGMEVRHDNGAPSDNRPSNLLYGTCQDNADDRKRHGTYFSGGEHSNAKLTNEQAAAIRDARLRRVKVKDLAAQYGVGVSTIEDVIYNRSYKEVQP
jgi:hypothetical protein